MLIDTHAHLTWDSFKPDFKEVLKRAIDAGIKIVINIGPSLKESLQAVALDCSPLTSYATIGAHPHEAINLPDDQSINNYINKLENIFQDNPKKVVAIGECGLDYHFAGGDYHPTDMTEDTQKKIQKKLFLAQINLAKKLNLPLIIHSRDSWEDIFLPELKGTTGVFHSFTGNKDQAQKALDLNYFLGFSCIITYPKNEHLREIIKTIPLEKILTETDCPFLPPQSKRGQRNEPANVIEVVKTIAEIKAFSFEQVANQTLQNAKILFNLSH